MPAQRSSEGAGASPGDGEGAGLTREQLARRAQTTPEHVDRLVQLGVLTPGDGAAPYGQGDVRRVRLVDACAQSGLPVESIAAAIRAGRLSLAFLDLLSAAGGGLTDVSFAELCDRNGLPIELMQRLHEAMGFGRPEPHDPTRSYDAEMVTAFQVAGTLGLDETTLVRVARVYGDNLRRIAQAEPEFYHDHVEVPLLASGLDERQMREVATQLSPQLYAVVEGMLLAIYRHHQERYTIDHLVRHIEQAVEASGAAPPRQARPPAMCFLDLTGYTRLTEERGDQTAARLAASLADLVERLSVPRGGQPVKWLGDGVMFHFRDPGPAVLAALDMVGRTPHVGLPPAHVGLHAGPVIFQDGDYYGRTVNLAARIAAWAGPGQVLVSEQVVAATTVDGIAFQPVGTATLKGVPNPVPLYEAVQA